MKISTIKWNEVNMRSKTEKNLPEEGAKVLLMTSDTMEVAEYRHERFWPLHAYSTYIKPKTGMLWVNCADVRVMK